MLTIETVTATHVSQYAKGVGYFGRDKKAHMVLTGS